MHDRGEDSGSPGTRDIPSRRARGDRDRRVERARSPVRAALAQAGADVVLAPGVKTASCKRSGWWKPKAARSGRPRRRHRSGGLHRPRERGHERVRSGRRAGKQAGVGTAVPALKETPEQFRSVVDLNLNASYWMAQACRSFLQSIFQIGKHCILLLYCSIIYLMRKRINSQLYENRYYIYLY